MHGERSRDPGTRREHSSGEEAAPVTAMAAESALPVVEKLQALLAANQDPKKLLKYLKKLSTLPITVDILAETGVGKTVNSFRKHEHVGNFARGLVAQWKKLVPVERNPEPEEQDFEKCNSRKRPRDVLQKEEEMEMEYQENWKASGSRASSTDHRHKKPRKLSELERPPRVSHGHERDQQLEKSWVIYLYDGTLLLTSTQEEEEAGFTGRRMNSKMQVYSGSKCAYLPKMMTLQQQCIRVLKNNIDSIFEVGGVPYHLLEPVLERCTPSQLYRIEECNHVLIEDTDQLWKIHCHRDFKEERPEEYESWREMYLRLHDAREQRLRLLTKNIQSAHANKPKGRQAKMAFVNSVAKPPRDVRRRQEKFGTGGAAVPDRIKIKPALDLTGSSHTSFSSGSSNSAHPSNGPSTSSAHLAPVVSSSVSYDAKKPAVKKIAPMMAKTIKAFKNRFSRR
ncbi:PREDICTED: transcription elongation factor B polypeptide 3 [Elephantulus edwardii]|uniref:transcription elongation factor B polypeptide 3 n=1 Tax=Elephantulus edwardii TaxID=28737 RepID=UPI0003F07886|nr:PREDICTED: transcription elongation factor B polypeptide 3 [Elephantulus edwardii]